MDPGGIATVCQGSNQDGDLRLGRRFPRPRFTANGGGTVTDNGTGFHWLRDASCASLPGTDASGAGIWVGALGTAAALGQGQCGLSDGSSPGDWRLPNRNELFSLVDDEYANPAMAMGNAQGDGQASSGDPFSGVQVNQPYWTSTSAAEAPEDAWFIVLNGQDFRISLSGRCEGGTESARGRVVSRPAVHPCCKGASRCERPSGLPALRGDSEPELNGPPHNLPGTDTGTDSALTGDEACGRGAPLLMSSASLYRLYSTSNPFRWSGLQVSSTLQCPHFRNRPERSAGY
ncbi:MAG: DUF1566 domain-containing protein [Thermoanaerobaculia bacterium]|nr:DUF1566 domain-containing protein [Thermoanaerobaculia bacterium]